MSDPREIAEGLTEVQRQALLEASDGHVALKWGYPNVVGALAQLGCLPPRCLGLEQDSRLTRLGLQVRAILEEKKKGEGL